VIVSNWLMRDKPLALRPTLSRDAGEAAFTVQLDPVRL
jgi:hypothetical protein